MVRVGEYINPLGQRQITARPIQLKRKKMSHFAVLSSCAIPLLIELACPLTAPPSCPLVICWSPLLALSYPIIIYRYRTVTHSCSSRIFFSPLLIINNRNLVQPTHQSPQSLQQPALAHTQHTTITTHSFELIAATYALLQWHLPIQNMLWFIYSQS